MLNLNFQPFPLLETKRTHLRKQKPSDLDAMYRLRLDEKVLKYLGREKAKSKQEVSTFMQMVEGEITANRGIQWVIELKSTPGLIGTVGYRSFLKEHDRAEVGYSLLPEFQQQGIMYEVLSEVLRFGFQELHLHSIEANIDPFNKASQGLLEKCNFVKEAHFKENYFFNGVYGDSAIYSLLNPYT